MKTMAIILAVLMVFAVGAAGYLWMNTDISVQSVVATATEASADAALFEELGRQMADQEVIGIRFSNDKLKEAENYQLLTYTIRMNNQSYLPMDMVEVQISPMDGDVLQIGEEQAVVIPARSSGTFQVRLLTEAKSNPVREMTISYYQWGMPFFQKTRYRSGSAQ